MMSRTNQLKPFAPLGKILKVEAGKSYRTYRRKNGLAVTFNICCGCGLTHLDVTRVNKNYLTCYSWRDEAQTKLNRRRMKRCYR